MKAFLVVHARKKNQDACQAIDRAAKELDPKAVELGPAAYLLVSDLERTEVADSFRKTGSYAVVVEVYQDSWTVLGHDKALKWFSSFGKRIRPIKFS
jgi:sugar phosphate isomerase/epimerase